MSLPRFSILGTYDLKKILSYVGVTKIFEEHGELTRIVPNRSLKVGEVSLLGLGAPPPPPPAQGASTQPQARVTVTAAEQAGILPTSQAKFKSRSAPTSHVTLGES